MRNAAKLGFDQLQKNFGRMGMQLPTFALQHASNTSRGLEIWMCTVGAGIVPERRDEVREIWHYLSSARPHAAKAIQNLREIERKTAEFTGGQGGMFSELTDSDWIKACGFVPSAFVRELGM